MTTTSAPPTFTEPSKFNGSNWVAWKSLVTIAVNLRGAYGYLDGTTPKPSPNPQNTPLPASPTTTTIPAPTILSETPWESTTPTMAEWKVRDAWAMGLLIYNTTDPIGLGIDISGTAADAWKSYRDTYEIASEISIINADRDLRNTTYNDGDDFQEFINRMRTKWSNATALGAPIDDKAFRTIVLSALPQSWDPIVATLYTTQSSRDAINQLMTHWARISRDRIMNARTSTSALQAFTNKQSRNRFRSDLVCSNPNCGRTGHTIEECYWPGGGKPGQFPSWFRLKKGGAKGNSNPNIPGQSSANAADTGATANANSEPKVFALAAITEVDAKVLSNTTIPNSSAPNSSTILSRTYCDVVRQGEMAKKGGELSVAGSEDNTHTIPQSLIVTIPELTTTLLDSGASDHCFVNKNTFSSYQQISPPRTGNSAGKGSTFAIEGMGTAELLMGGQETISKVLLTDSLHTPNLRSNLISVSKLVSKGARVSFEGDIAVVRDTKGESIFTATRRDGLYVLNVVNKTGVHSVRTGKNAVPYEIWHRRLGHIPVDAIAKMFHDELVDGLKTTGEAKLRAICEDCLYGKHTTHPFNNTVQRETDPLECIYVDIWGPASTQSAGGAKYFMLCIDGATSYRKVYFLSSKTAEVTLKIFKEFHVESERQTGRKLKRVRLDMGREWCNTLWDRYAKEQGVILDFATPYAHQQNGRAERSMRTLLDMARSMLADAGLPQKYWADAVQTAAYIRNLVPTSNSPAHVPAERWSQKRQDISHLRAFGCTCYAHVPVEISPSKLAPRSVKLTMIGYFEHAGYKLLDKSTGKTFRSRDVVFDEQPPHYSTDDAVTYTSGDEPISANDLTAVAPRPQPISTLHPANHSPTPTSPTTSSTAGPAGNDDQGSGAEVSEPLNATNGADEPPTLRRSRRETKPSRHMLESLEYLNRTRAHVSLTPQDLAADGLLSIPQSYHEAMKRPDLWLEPMVKELQVMRDKGVYRLVPRPLGKNVVKSRWVFANKYDDAGNVITHKARLVAKGFTQVLGEDYDETYASVARLESVRLVCAIAASLGLHLWQADFVSAFLNSDNAFEVYMEQPPGFEEGGDDDVWLLLKTLYGTMQGAHDWAKNLERAYRAHGYYTSKADPQVRSRVIGDEITLTSTWTDDILGASSTKEGEIKAKGELAKSYELKDLGAAKFILGMKIEKIENSGDIRLSQQAYCERTIERFKMNDAKPRSTPLPAGLTLSADDSPKNRDELDDMKNVPYRQALGSLMWLQVATRPDLSYAVNLLSRFANNPGRKHWEALKHTLAYLKGTSDYGITYRHGGDLRPYGYVDADYAGDGDSSRSTEGHVFFVAGGPVSWTSKRQDTVALSTVEAEYTAFTRASQQAMWINKSLVEVGLRQEWPTNIFADNQGAIANTQNYKNHRRTKHVRIKYHFVKERVEAGEISFPYIPSADNLADILTKPLPREAVLRCCRGIGLLRSA
jgi:hypothetical protein